MQINYLGKGKFELKTKNTTVILDEEIKIGEKDIVEDGEYEISEVEIEKNSGLTTVHLENMNLVYLGKRNQPLNDKEIEIIDGLDILFLPVGSESVYDAKQAQMLINQIEPKIIIPMYYPENFDFSIFKGFISETLPNLKISQNQIIQYERKIIRLLPEKSPLS